MKLLIITVIKEFEEDVKKILFDAGIREFTSADVIGNRDTDVKSMSDNWFAKDGGETDSKLFWILAPDEKVMLTKASIETFNSRQHTPSRIHLAILKTEGSI